MNKGADGLQNDENDGKAGFMVFLVNGGSINQCK